MMDKHITTRLNFQSMYIGITLDVHVVDEDTVYVATIGLIFLTLIITNAKIMDN